MQQFRRWIASISSLLVAAASFALSYVALRDVAADIGAVPRHLAWLVPIVIDGGIMCGSAVIWSASREEGRRPLFPFFFVASMVTISVVVNASHASDKILAKVIAALPPLILLGTLELVASQGRKHAVASPAPATGGAPAAVQTPSTVAAPTPVAARQAPAAQSWAAGPAALDPELVDDIEDAFVSAHPVTARPARPAPARTSATAAKRAPRVQAAEPDFDL